MNCELKLLVLSPGLWMSSTTIAKPIPSQAPLGKRIIIETTMARNNGSAVPVAGGQRVLVIWSDCFWAVEICKTSQASSVRPHPIRRLPERSTKSPVSARQLFDPGLHRIAMSQE